MCIGDRVLDADCGTHCWAAFNKLSAKCSIELPIATGTLKNKNFKLKIYFRNGSRSIANSNNYLKIFEILPSHHSTNIFITLHNFFDSCLKI